MKTLEIKNNKIYIDDKEYPIEGTEITIFLNKKYKGKLKLRNWAILFFTGLFFYNFFISLLVPTLYNNLLFVFFVVNLPYVSFFVVIPFRHIINKYYPEYVVITMNSVELGRLPYSDKRKNLVNEILHYFPEKKIVWLN
ncbi:hypothetical protein [Ferroplasma sp.]|uniref:hypothetical protein n=1 Tax=Ferroplasma sp. TaxID=2591003 RepID=UPI00307D6CD3